MYINVSLITCSMKDIQIDHSLSLAKQFKSFFPILQFNAHTAFHKGGICLFNNKNTAVINMVS